MAEAAEDLDAPPPHQHEEEERRISLLDLLRQRSEQSGKKFQVHRAVVVFNLKPGTKDAEAEAKLAAIVARHREIGALNGLQLVYPLSGLLLLEGEQKCVVGAIKAMDALHRSWAALADVKVVSSIQDAPQQAFSFWTSQNIGGSRGEANSYEKEQLPQIISKISVDLQSIGKKLSPLGDAQRNASLEGIKTKFADVLPRVEDVLGLATCEHTPSAADYLGVYYAPFDLVLDSELVWPLPQPLEY
jgi:hypothetical protein